MAIVGNYKIARINYETAMRVVTKYHYLHRPAPCSFAFGLYEINGDSSKLFTMDRLVGVITYGTPSSAPLRSGICGVEEKDNVIELTRLWVEDSTPKNAESYLIGNTLPMVNKEIVVSFAEIEAGHVGTVYQATNWIYTGLSAKRTNWTIEGVELHGQTIADKYTSKELRAFVGDRFKLKDRPRKHRYVYLNCTKRRKKQLLSKLRYCIEPYPKFIKCL
jgi:hypothetical protein